MPLLKRKKKEIREIKLPSSKIVIKLENKKVNPEIHLTLNEFKEVFLKDLDFSYRNFKLFGEIPAIAIFISSLVDKDVINKDIIKPLQKKAAPETQMDQYTKWFLEDVLYHCNGKEEDFIVKLLEGLLRGDTVVLIEGEQQALLLETANSDKRGIEQPETERVVRGPRDGFIEHIQSNIALIRYRLPVPELRIESVELGTLTKTKIGISYIEGIVNEELLKEVKKRVKDIKIDRILDAGYIEQFIQDNPRSPFPQVQNTERPDKVIGNLVEGRIAILVDGTPFALIVPATFNQFYQTSEDYNEKWLITTIVRLIRYFALISSLTFSSLYITILSFHPEMIPAKFIVAASSGRAGVPFPVVVEVLIMEFAMEILREATVRMPQQVGGALSIVGVLVVGQAAVMAGFVSPITVVIIAMSSIGSFATPSYNAATAFRMLRFPLIILAGTFGLLGLSFGIILVINHMISLRSFGVPYLIPISPFNLEGMKDSFIRAPLRWMTHRPSQLHVQDVIRLDSGVKEGPTNPLNKKEGDQSGQES